MAAPDFFASDTRRSDLAWNDWDAVRAFIEGQRVCRIAVNDDVWPYVVAQSYRFDGESFYLNFSRNGKLAALLARDPHCTLEVDETLRLSHPPETLNADYRSVIARCRASLREIDIGHGRRIIEARVAVVKLSAKRRPSDLDG